MQADGLTPIAFTDKDGWPAMGTFDILNMRINGYQFHVDLMAGKQSWDSPQVKAVFNQWKELLPYYSRGRARPHLAGGRAAAREQAGRHVPARLVRRAAVHEAGRPCRPRLLPVPVINPKWGQDSLDAPIDGFMLSKGQAKNADGKKLLGVPRQRRRCRTPTSRPTRTTSARTSTRATGTTARCRRRRRADRAARSTSRSTWTATRGPTSPRR